MGPTGLSASAWGTLIVTSSIFYGGFVYYTLIALQINPKDLPAMFMRMAHPDYIKKMWMKDNTTKMMLAGLVIFMLIIVALVAGFGGYENIDAGEADNGLPEEEPVETIFIREILVDQTGSGGGKFLEGSAKVPFTLGEGGKILILNLTSPDGHAATDYDLVLLDPNGNSIATSGNAPGEDEQIIIDYTKNVNKTLSAGAYAAEIVFFGGTRGTTWHLEVTVWYEAECTDEGCAIE